MNQTKPSLGARGIGIIILTLATALIHAALAFSALRLGDMTTFSMFILNGLGYLTLLAAYYLPLPIARDYPKLVRWAFVAFTAVTILGWVAFGERNWVGYGDKLIELALIVLLLTDRR